MEFEMKPTKDYKMPKTLKRVLSLSNFRTTEMKNEYKNAMIVADLHEKTVAKTRAVRTEEKGE
jgi:phage I-like protein